MDGAAAAGWLVAVVNAAVAAYLLLRRQQRAESREDAEARQEELREHVQLLQTDQEELKAELAAERRLCAEERLRAARDRERMARLESRNEWMEDACRAAGIRFPAFNPDGTGSHPVAPPPAGGQP